ncbi:MAG: hypothetical protein A2X86_04960 [Bdellovibrionales bacterium GWA2_49_15]|nr:MAG: hypothetical protein A2X86_04960 [Bdellovibrionales bacterium GWA2_49_15]
MKKIITALICTALSLVGISGFAAETLTMRKCVLLPITDELDNSIGFKVFENVEKHLRESSWCYYRSNSEIINILNNYRKNLSAHLQNPEIIAVVAEKTNAGSLIKIQIRPGQSGNVIQLTIIGQNGADIYFNESTTIKELDVELISQTIFNWLTEYQKLIPYDGLVTSILGMQVAIDAGTDSGLSEGTEFKIVKPVRKRAHPLLKEIVDWETEVIGRGTIFHANNSQSQGKINEIKKQSGISINDWIVKINNVTKETVISKIDESNKFGKLGEASVGLAFNHVSTTLADATGTSRSLSGVGGGVGVGVETWITRIYWSSLYIDKAFASLSKKEGNFQNSSYTVGPSTLKLKVGYKYLPLGFFYGPQLDVGLGYGKYSYSFDNSTADGLTQFSFKGLMFTVRGTIPIKNLFRAGIGLDILVMPKYAEDINIYGEAESTTGYDLSFFGKYNYAPAMTLDGELNIQSTSAKFSRNREVSNKRTSVKFGTTFSF